MANAHRFGRPRMTTSRPNQKMVQAATSVGRFMSSKIGNEQKMIPFTCLIVPITFSAIESKIITESIRLEMGIMSVNDYFFYQNPTFSMF